MSESVRVMVFGKVTLQLAPLGHGNGLWAYSEGGIRVADPPVTAVPLLDTAACGVTPGHFSPVLALIIALPLIWTSVVASGGFPPAAQMAQMGPIHFSRVTPAVISVITTGW